MHPINRIILWLALALACFLPAFALTPSAVGEVFVNSVSSPTELYSYGYGLTLGGYGPEPGSYLNTNTSQWRDHYADFDTGFIYFGARYYEDCSGRWLSADPLGNASSMSLYDYCDGDPVNGLDPDGRFQSGFSSGENGSIASNAPNSTLFSIGLYAGSLASGGETGLQNAVGGDVSAFTFGNVQGAFGSDPTSSEYQFARDSTYVGIGSLTLAGGIVAAPILAEGGSTLIESSPTLTSLYVGATGLANSNLVLELGGATLAGGVGYQALEQEVESQAPLIESEAAQLTQAAEGIATPYGVAVQETSAEALQAQEAVQNGATLYRGGVLGKSAGPEAQFWSLENPLSPGYAEKYGIPAENMNFDFIETGTLNPGTNFITRGAPGLGSNAGGAIEVVTPSGGVTLNGFYMP